MHIIIPWEHVVSKNQKITVWNGRRPALTGAYRAAKEAVHELAKEQVDQEPYDSSVKIEFHMYPPDRRRRDILNYTQLICDGIEGIAYTNDWRIDEALIVRGGVDKLDPRVEVRIYGYEERRP